MKCNRFATFAICERIDASSYHTDAETVANIAVVVTDDELALINTDSQSKNIAFVDITDPANPKADGIVKLSGEPTSVAVNGDKIRSTISIFRYDVGASQYPTLVSERDEATGVAIQWGAMSGLSKNDTALSRTTVRRATISSFTPSVFVFLLRAVVCLLLLDRASVFAAYSKIVRTTVCGTDQALARVDLLTDDFPSETAWSVRDITTTNDIALVLSSIPYVNTGKLHTDETCVDISGCYQFVITDTSGEGICCRHGDGSYDLYYNNVKIMEGGDFGSSEESILFGDGCPSASPSVSSLPTSNPTNVSLSNPIISSAPTSNSTMTPDLIALDDDNRRYFPKRPKRPEGSFAFQPVPNCKSDDNTHVGCVAVPSTIRSEPPDWAGKLHFQPPVCSTNKIGGNRQCDLRIPMSRKVLTESLSVHPDFDGFPTSVEILPGNSLDSNVVVLADINDDGYLDLIIGNINSSNQLMVNNGDGSFDKDLITLPGGAFGTTSVAVGDVNGDGHLDLLIGNAGGSNQLLMNNGDGSFNEDDVITLPGGGLRTFSVAVGDVNGDGYLDVIIGNRRASNQLLMNNGDGSFDENPITLPGGALFTLSVAVGDINGDGYLDVIIGNVDKSNQLLMNNGNGSFDEDDRVTLPGGVLFTNSVAVGDVNGDGYLDIIIGSFKSNFLLMNNGDGSFAEDDFISLPGGVDTRSVAVGDVNGDGYLDLITGINLLSNQLFINNGDGSFNENPITLPGEDLATFSVAMGDINCDGYLDVVIGNNGVSNQLFINKGDGSLDDRSFDKDRVMLPGGALGTTSVAVVDINGDGYLDLIIGNFFSSNQLLMNNGDGSFDEDNLITLPGGVFDTFSVAVGDFNGDGYLDLIIGNADVSNQLLMNNGDGSFNEDDVITLSGGDVRTGSVAVGDVNGDGHLDVIIGNIDSSNQLLMNNGDGSFDKDSITLPGGVLDTLSVAVGDVNGDGHLDVVIGNYDESNQLLMNNGNGSFDEDDLITLPGGVLATFSVAVGDVNGDGYLDLIIGNAVTSNQLLMNNGNQLLMNNGDGSFIETPNTLPGEVANINTPRNLPFDESRDRPFRVSVAVGDVNGDGHLDVIIGNVDTSNQLLMNNGDGSFDEDDLITLPGGVFDTVSVAVGDVNGDGHLNVIIGNIGNLNHLILFSPCPNGGAKLHSKSWCYNCPPFMVQGRFSNCIECLPDHIQQPGAGDKCNSCPIFTDRKFGEDTCRDCVDGTFYDTNLIRDEFNSSTWNTARCVPCSPGEYAPRNLNVIDQCLKCLPGMVQPNPQSNSCQTCAPGSFQTEVGQSYCENCSTGGYCDSVNSCNGGFVPCSPGSYNNMVGQKNETACRDCPPGTFSTMVGGNSLVTCLECPPGTFNNETGQTQCQPCGNGMYQQHPGMTLCVACDARSYADKKGLAQCIPCPYRVSSDRGSKTCPFCDSGFYLKDPSATVSAIFQTPDEHCLSCSSDAQCLSNTTLQTLGIPSGFWRDSLDTSKLYRCDNKACQGDTQILSNKDDMLKRSSSNIAPYCKEGHTGPLCEVCTERNDYFSPSDGMCIECPSLSRLVVQAALVISGTIALIIMVHAAFIRNHNRLSVITTVVSSLSLRAKFKVLVSFYQVVSSLDAVYGVKLHSSLTKWTNVFNFISLDIFEFIRVPKSCIGSMRQQLIISAVWPYLTVMLLTGLLVLGVWFMKMWCREGYLQKCNTRDISISLIIIVFYFALPPVSRGIFDAKKCQAFKTNDAPEELFRSYLVADFNIECSTSDDDKYASLLGLFWGFFVLWPVLMPIFFMLLLVYVRQSVRAKSPTPLAGACRFLWEDYDESMMFWDVIDTWRKLFLTGFIFFVDPEEGSNKSLRLTIATTGSTLYLSVLTIARPYKRNDDYYLAFLSNFLLICCFIMGVTLQLCNAEDEVAGDNITCSRFVGLSLDSYKASMVVVFLTIGMFVITIAFLLVISINAITSPIVRLVNTGYPPNLELPENCTHHVFMSHVWVTGQAKTHAIARKLKVLLPALKIWLDVDDLKDTSALEQSVSDSAVIILFYSKGYFQSKNCQREIYAAVEYDKPVILLYEGDASDVKELKSECRRCCTKEPGSDRILEHITRCDPICWLNEGAFSAAALQRIFRNLLGYLPHYQNNRMQLLDDGIKIPGAIGIVKLNFPFQLLVCEANVGALPVAEEIQTILSINNDVRTTTIKDAQALQDHHGEGNDDSKRALLLYLNKDFCVDNCNNVSDIVQAAHNLKIDIILVNEQDEAKGACHFNLYLNQTPQVLMDPPIQLFKEIAIPLYSTEGYRIISLRVLGCRMGGTPVAGNRKYYNLIKGNRSYRLISK